MDGPWLGTELPTDRAVSDQTAKAQEIETNLKQAYCVHPCFHGAAPKNLQSGMLLTS